MALSASWHPAPSLTAGLTDRHERQRAFMAARRHSRLVRRLRWLLPLCGGWIIVGFIVVTNLALPENLDLSVARLSVTRNSIIMDNPHLTGFDADKREYSVTADRAVQALADPDTVRLDEIVATVKTAGQGTATISAEAGDYDNQETTLKLVGAIAVSSSEGYALRMTDADIDLRAGTMHSANPVTVRFATSSTTAGSISVSAGGQVIVLENGVRTTLLPPKRASPQGAQAAEE